MHLIELLEDFVTFSLYRARQRVNLPLQGAQARIDGDHLSIRVPEIGAV